MMQEIPRRHVLKGAFAGGLVWAQVSFTGKAPAMSDVEGRPIQRVKDPNAMTDLEKEHLITIDMPAVIRPGEPFKVSIAMPNHPMFMNHYAFMMRSYLDRESVSYTTFAPTWQRPETVHTYTFTGGTRLEVIMECTRHGLWGAYAPLDFQAPDVDSTAVIDSTAAVDSSGT